MRYRNILILAIGLLVISSLASAESTSQADIIQSWFKKFDAANAKITSLQAKFTQIKTLSLFESKITSTGIVKLQRPGKLYWETHPPDASTIIINGDKTSFKVPKSKPEILSLSKSPKLKFILEHLVPGFGPPMVEWKKDFNIQLLEAKSPEKVRIKLIPNDKVKKGVASWIKQIVIQLNTTAGYPEAVTLTDNDDDLTEVSFTWKTSKKKLAEKTFTIKSS